jgi:hypothetical protein
MTTEKTDTGKGGNKALSLFKPMLNPMKQVGEGLVGFSAGHVAFSNMPSALKGTGLKGFGIGLAIAFLSIFISTKVKNDHVKNGLYGFSLYSGIKAVNSLMTNTQVDPTVKGLGAYQLPAGAVNILNKMFPNLGAAEPIHVDFSGMEIYDRNADLGAAVDQTYEFVNAMDNLGELDNTTSFYNKPVSLAALDVEAA